MFVLQDRDCLSMIRGLLQDLTPVSTARFPCQGDDIELRENELALLILAKEVLENALVRSQGCPHKTKV